MFAADEERQTETLTGTPQPGSLEALKNMLFKLQTEAAAHAAGNPTTLDNLQVCNTSTKLKSWGPIQFIKSDAIQTRNYLMQFFTFNIFPCDFDVKVHIESE